MLRSAPLNYATIYMMYRDLSELCALLGGSAAGVERRRADISLK
jgi:hypothetical protein